MIAVCCGFRVFAALLGSWGLRRLPPHAQTRLSSRWGALISGAPIRAGGASPLRVATGGDANWRVKARLRRSPASTNRRHGWRLWIKSPIESGSPWDSIPGLLTTKSVLVCSPRDTVFSWLAVRGTHSRGVGGGGGGAVRLVGVGAGGG